MLGNAQGNCLWNRIRGRASSESVVKFPAPVPKTGVGAVLHWRNLPVYGYNSGAIVRAARNVRYGAVLSPGRVQMRVWAMGLACAMACAGLPAAAQLEGTHAKPLVSKLEFTSSDQRLVQGFDWASRQAMDYVFTGDPVGPWYEAALPGREAFCMRDTAHQSVGAQALGLSAWTLNMLRRFGENISASKQWCSYWEIDRFNEPSPADYESDTSFWYDLPANFDVLDSAYRMYLWTGDPAYIDDPVLDNFYDRTMNEYVKRWELSADKVMTRERFPGPLTGAEQLTLEHGGQIHLGIPGYDEGNHTFVVGIDLLAVEYAAFRDYAAIERLRGNDAGATTAEANATALKNLINTTWWNPKDNTFYALLDQDHHLTGSDSQDVLYWNAVEPGPKMESAVKAMLMANEHRNPCGVEGESHDAEILYRYGQDNAAYGVLLDLTTPGHCRQEYPEVSYSVVGAITTGLMGINMVPVQDREVETLPGLTDATTWAQLSNLPIGRNAVTIRHNGDRETVFTNQDGPALIWQAAFPGTFSQLLVNGKPMPAHNETQRRTAISWVEVPVGAGDTVRVSAP